MTQRGNVYSPFGDLLAILSILHDFTWLAADKFPASMYDFPGSFFPISTLSAALMRCLALVYFGVVVNIYLFSSSDLLFMTTAAHCLQQVVLLFRF